MASEGAASPPKRVAIVGAGISGIACSWTLREVNYLVDIYDTNDRIGGHANSVPFRGNGKDVIVDTGFIAMDKATYPQFSAFLDQLGVETIPTDMSFGVSTTDGAFEWGSYSVWSFVGRLSLLVSPWFWRLVFDILRFSYFARDILSGNKCEPIIPQYQKNSMANDLETAHLESIGSYLKRQRYSDQFSRYFLIPMVAAPWCADPDDFSRTFPAKPLIAFMNQHRLLETVSETLRWRSFANGSQTYLDAFQKSLPSTHRLCLGTPVHRVRQRREVGANIELGNGSSIQFDHIVLAVHANQALNLLGEEATSLERDILASFKTSRNICYLHSDSSLLPKRSSARAAWNCLLERHYTPDQLVNDYKGGVATKESPTGIEKSRISVTFDMNRLQAIPMPGESGSPGRVFVTMNPLHVPQSSQSRQVYQHPIICSESIAALQRLHQINGVMNVSFAGAWMGYAFYEDGFAAGSHAAQMLIHGREKTAPLNLLAEHDIPRTSLSVIDMLSMFAIATIQSLLSGGKMKRNSRL